MNTQDSSTQNLKALSDRDDIERVEMNSQPDNGEKSFSAVCLNSALWKFFWGFLIMSLNLSGVPAVFAAQGAVAAGLIFAALWQLMPCGKDFRAALWLYSVSVLLGSASYFLLGVPNFSSDSALVYINMLNTVLFTVVLLLISIGCTKLFRVKKTEGKLAIRWSWLLYLTVFAVALYLGGGQDVSGIMGYIGLAAFVIILIQISSSRKKLFAAGVDCKARPVGNAAGWCVSVLAVLLVSVPFLSAVVYQTREAPAAVYEPYDVSNQQEALEKDREIRGNLVKLGAFDKLVADLPQSLVEKLEKTTEVDDRVALIYIPKSGKVGNLTEDTRPEFDCLAWNTTLFKQDMTAYCVLYMEYVEDEAIKKAGIQTTGLDSSLSYSFTPDEEVRSLFFSTPAKPSQQYRDVIVFNTHGYTLVPKTEYLFTIYNQDGRTWRADLEEVPVLQNKNELQFGAFQSDIKKYGEAVKLASKGEQQRVIICMEIAGPYARYGSEKLFNLTMEYTHWKLPFDTPYHHLFNDPGLPLSYRSAQWVTFDKPYTEREGEI